MIDPISYQGLRGDMSSLGGTSSSQSRGNWFNSSDLSLREDTKSNHLLGPRTGHDASFSAAPPRRSKKQAPPRNTTRLGAIDEHSNSVAPDTPSRHPDRKYKYGNATKFFAFGAYARSDNSLPPVDAYEKVVGPRGEKFNDLRQNRPYRPPNRGGWRRVICLGLVILLILLAIGLGVGLGIGLTRSKETRYFTPMVRPACRDPSVSSLFFVLVSDKDPALSERLYKR